MAKVKSVDFYEDAKRVFENLNNKKIKTIQEHDAELLDRCSMTFKSIIHNRHGQMSSETEKELFADIDTFIAAMKAEVNE